jgi:hypothetical protein
MRYVSTLLLILCCNSLTSAQAPTDTSITLQVTSGWNLISLPVKVANNNSRILFPTAVSNAFTYDEGYVTHDSMLLGKGYWMKFAAFDSIIITGKKIIEDTIDVPSGWSMFGSISVDVDTQNIVTIPEGVIKRILKICPWFDCYVTSIEPGHAYWLQTTSSGKIILKTN